MKVYISDIKETGAVNKIDINNLDKFEGLVFDCVVLEPEYQFSVNIKLINIKHQIKLPQEAYRYKREPVIIWLVTESHIQEPVIAYWEGTILKYFTKEYPKRINRIEDAELMFLLLAYSMVN